MAEHLTIEFEDVSLEEARRMGRGPRMEPMLYETLRRKIQISPTRMKSYILRIARDENVLVTVRRLRGGVIFWRSTDEDIQQAKEVGARLQTTRQKPKARPRGGRRRSTR
jgi:hypothetical protein